MAKLLLLVVCVSVASALPERSGKALSDLRASHHHSSNPHSPDPTKCIDISTYKEVMYNPSSFTLRGYVCEKNCETKTQEICHNVETTDCDLEGYADCKEELVETDYLNVDGAETVEFIPQRCWEDGTQVKCY